jgi:hypothetical protein
MSPYQLRVYPEAWFANVFNPDNRASVSQIAEQNLYLSLFGLVGFQVRGVSVQCKCVRYKIIK